METSNRPRGRISRSLAFGAARRVKPGRPLKKDRSRCDGLQCLTLRHGVKHRPCLICRTAVYGPVRTVVWEGRSRETPPYPDRPGMTVHHFRIEQRLVRVRNKPPLTGIETKINPRVTRRRFHGTLFVVVAARCPASHSGPDLRVRRFALEFDAAKKRPRSVAAFRVDRARIERARMGASSASRVFQQPFWLLQGTRQREQ
jgi:hypothetical protein